MRTTAPAARPRRRARREPHAEKHERLNEAEHQRPGQLRCDQRETLHRREREPVDEAALDVGRDRLAGVRHCHHRAVREGDDQRERPDCRGREALYVRRLLQPGGDEDEQDQRDEQGGRDAPRVTEGPLDGAPSEESELPPEGCFHAPGAETSLGVGGRTTSIALVPSPIVSPGASSVGNSIRLPFTQVPFSDCRSSTTSVPSTTRMAQ